MKRLKVEVSPEVQNQILEQVLFIAKHSINNALAWEVRVRAAMNSIGDIQRHAIDEEATERLGEVLRKLVFEKTYLIHYRVDELAGTARITNFRHGARLPRKDEP